MIACKFNVQKINKQVIKLNFCQKESNQAQLVNEQSMNR